jgi:catechol 2,3-dioxygenase-like lactoylglutathione lyase family enzyme
MSIGVGDPAASIAFYDAVLAPLGSRRLFRAEHYVGYGSGAPDGSFGICRGGRPQDGTHVCFAAGTREEVAAFHAAALAAGGTDNGAPGYRPEYAPDYYGAFALDPDGNRLGVVARVRPEASSTPRARIIDHLSIGTNDLEEAARFYDALFGSQRVRRLRTARDFIKYGTDTGDSTFIIGAPDDGRRTAPQLGFHVCFSAASRDLVASFHAAGLAVGAGDNGAPGYRPEYGFDYFGAFLLDPWGNHLGVVARVPPDEP